MKLSFIILMLFSISSKAQYNRIKAVNYADSFACENKENCMADPLFHNSKYKIYTRNKDCANFVSQCLIAGGIKLSGKGINNEGCLRSCDNLNSFLTDPKFTQYYVSVNPKCIYNADDNRKLNNLLVGDVVIFGSCPDNYEHAVIVVEMNEPRINAHTNNRYHVRLSGFYPNPKAWQLVTYYFL